MRPELCRVNLAVDLLYGYLDPAPPCLTSAATAGTGRRARRGRAVPWRLLLPVLPVALAVLAGALAPWVMPHSPTTGNLLG